MAVPKQGAQHMRALDLTAKSRPSEYKKMACETNGHVCPDRESRTSFSSIREQESDLSQTFTHSRVSHYTNQEEAVDDSASTSTNEDSGSDNSSASPRPPKRSISKVSDELVQPSRSFMGWKQVPIKGRVASKSSGDLKRLTAVWSTTTTAKTRDGAYSPGEAPFERLPFELLGAIIDLLVLDIPPNGLAKRNVDLVSLLQVSRRLHAATLGSLYQRITIPHSRIFQKFLTIIRTHRFLGEIVRRLDFCHFNPSQLFSTASERAQARNLTSETLLECLELTPNLQEFLGQEQIEDDLDAAVLQKLFLGLPRLTALDFCGCSSAKFRDAFAAIITPDWPAQLSITRLSLHKCFTFTSANLEAILSRLPRLTHLDVAGTRVTDAALAAIPRTAVITHLNLAKCTHLSAAGVTEFLSRHPAVNKNLIFLSLATDARSHQLLDVEDVTALLPLLPKTLKSLSLKGSKLHPRHIDLLRPLTKHLEELSLGRCLKVEHIERLFAPDERDVPILEQLDWVPHTLRFLDISDLWGGELDHSVLFSRSCILLQSMSAPLEVIEVAEDVSRRLVKSRVTLQRVGWRMSECGNRAWIVRNQGPVDGEGKTAAAARNSDGRRGWKMGAEAWGMRKIPVALADVGGMYGSFMFGRKL